MTTLRERMAAEERTRSRISQEKQKASQKAKALKEQQAAHAASVERMEKHIATLQAAVESRTDDATAKEKQIEQSQKMLSDLRQELQAINEDRKCLGQLREVLEKELAAARADAERNSESARIAQESCVRLQQFADGLQTSLNEEREMRGSLEDQLLSTQQSLETLQTHHAELSASTVAIEQLRHECEQLRSRCSAQVLANTNIEQQLITSKHQIAQLQETVQNRDEQLAQTTARLRQLQQKARHDEQEKKAAVRELQDLEVFVADTGTCYTNDNHADEILNTRRQVLSNEHTTACR